MDLTSPGHFQTTVSVHNLLLMMGVNYFFPQIAIQMLKIRHCRNPHLLAGSYLKRKDHFERFQHVVCFIYNLIAVFI